MTRCSGGGMRRRAIRACAPGAVFLGALFMLATQALPQWGGDTPFATSPADGRAWSFHGRRLLMAGGGSKPPSIWDLTTGSEIQTFRGHTEPVWTVAFSPDGTQAATVAAGIPLSFKPSTDNSVRVWDVASGREVRRFNYSGALGTTIQFSSDGKRLLRVDRSEIHVWDIATGSELFAIASPPSPRNQRASFSPDLRTILIDDGSSLRLFEYQNGKARCTVGPWSGHSFLDAKFDPDGRRIVSVFTEMPMNHSLSRAQIWDTDRCRQMQDLAATMTSFAHASFSADGMNIVANLSSPPSAQLWDARSGLEIRRFEPAGVKFVHDVLLSPDGRRLLTRSSLYRGTDIFETSLFDVESGQELQKFDEGFYQFFVAGFSPDGETILVTDKVRPVSLWSSETGKLIRRYP